MNELEKKKKQNKNKIMQMGKETTDAYNSVNINVTYGYFILYFLFSVLAAAVAAVCDISIYKID